MSNLSRSQKINLLRIAVSLILLALYFTLNSLYELNLWQTLLILTAAYIISGCDVLYEALRNIFRGKLLDENFLMSIATVGAYALGDYSEAVAVMVFYQVGELFQSYAVGKSRRSIADLMDICPEYANVYCDGALKSVDPNEVNVGDIIAVKPGEKIPLDGIVQKGTSRLDTSSITGESVSSYISEGDTVYSGSINLNSLLEIKVTRSYENSTVSKILELVEEASFNKSKSENFITAFSKVYTPIVVGCALALALIMPLFLGTFSLWLKRALIFLVVSCPCALVISVPLSFFAAIGCASSRGILIKGSNWLELLGKAQTVVFDKTGTLTRGNFTITSCTPAAGVDTEALLFAASACEYFSDHPIANAIKEAYPVKYPEKISGFENFAGLGVKAVYDGKILRCGNEKYISSYVKYGFEVTDAHSVVYVCEDDRFLGCIVVSDEIKPQAKEIFQALAKFGISSAILTGDRQSSAAYVARELGCTDVRSELLPADKTSELQKIISSKSKGRSVVYVGDGINDAPVLAMADVGIAMGSLGSDAAIEAADIVIMDDDISKISFAYSLCRKTNKIVRQNVAFAIGIKLLVMAFAAIGYSNMWAAIFADVGVAVLAILNSFRCFKN